MSSVQAAIALEALVSAAFILIGSKVGDLIGRKRAYVIGLLGYAAGALAMTLAQSVTAIVVFWAVIGGLGASLMMPAMQSLIHGNFEGAAQKRVYALVGASAAVAAAIGPLLGGFITTFLSWRVGFLLELVIIAIVLLGSGRIKDVPYTGPRQVDAIGAILSVLGMGGVVVGILAWQEGGDAVAELLIVGVVGLGSLAWWLLRRKREEKPTLIDPDLFRSKMFRFGISGQLLQNVALGAAMIALPIFLQMVLEYNALQTGLSLAPLSLTMFGVAVLAGKKAGTRRPSRIIRSGFALLAIGMVLLIAVVPRADSGWYLFLPLLIAGAGLGLLVSQLNNYTLSPDLGGAGQRGRGRELGQRIVRALVRPGVRRSHHAGDALDHLHGHGQRTARCSPPPSSSRSRPALDDERGGDEQHAARGAPRRPARRTSRPRSSASTRRLDRSRFRWRCSCRSSPHSSGW